MGRAACAYVLTTMFMVRTHLLGMTRGHPVMLRTGSAPYPSGALPHNRHPVPMMP